MRNSTELSVNLSHLAFNYALLKKRIPNNQEIFMVKANAYGHGLLEIVQFSYENLGVTEFGCASLGEAMTIRKYLPKLKCQIYVFSDSELKREDCREQYVDYNIFPVIHCLEDLKIVLNDSNLKWLPLTLKFDTGMHRLGMSTDEIDQVIELLKSHDRKEVHHLMTHFASSYLLIKEEDRTHRQYTKFLEVKSEFENAKISIKDTSCANSGAIEQNFGLEHSHVRPGLMLYGPAATGRKDFWSGKTISTLKTKILKLMPVKKGTPIGYGGHICAKNGFIMYLPIGYGDGFLTFFTGGNLKVEGKTAKVLGRVNMDLTALFFEVLPLGVKAESEIIIWNDSEFDISELSTQMKTIPYQLFTAITSRVPRRYIK
jgi:alanine racemase